MIPAHFDPEGTSPGEREVFERLRDDPATNNWVAFHSLHIAQHVSQLKGEADFVVFVPGQGVLVIEVKSHTHVSRTHDDWLLGGKKKKSPFTQAEEAMHSIKRKVTGIRGVPFTYAVYFTHARFSVPDAPEWQTWQAIDTVAFHRRSISQLVLSSLKNNRKLHTDAPSTDAWFDPNGAEPTPDTIARLVSTLRPVFDFCEPPKIRRQRRHEEVSHFTAEQYALIDTISDNPRCIVKGAAGTGKTFVAVEAARRYAAEGKRVLLCCFNKLLGEWLVEATQDMPDVTASHLHSYMRKTVKGPLDKGASDDQEYFTEILPERALTHILDEPMAPYDLLVIDEAQDLMLDSYLDVLDASLRGGLGSGSWLFFGDFTNQAIYNSGHHGLGVLTSRAPHAAYFKLSKNCRNTPDIAQYVEISSNLEPGYNGYLRPRGERRIQHEYWSTEADQLELLAQHLIRLKSEGYAPTEIAVISPHSDRSAAAALTKQPRWSRKLAPFREAGTSSIPYGTIHSFKGLDAPAVIVTDFASIGTRHDEALFYIASSRARDDLSVLTHESTRHDFQRIVLGDAS
ncbi:nuclease-related domain-containing DEAD/DEAH box helicase [Streptomyces alboflavus]|uniref:nuclease-related domain-containing DEAD/DEAH box helicase n=1 Tax=Streptomyces alboflavus TaxID=67267 RepID=UPI001F1674BE|nr:NERD domain-containing protein [Streptomyces alboflavus]